MSHPLQQKIRAIRRSAHRLLLLYGLACFLGVLVLAAFLVGLADYLIRFQDQGVRLICSLAVLAASGWAFYRFLIPVLTYRQSDVQIAQKIERRFPLMRDQLSSTLDFLAQSEEDATAGSAELRRAVVAETTGKAADMDFRQCLNPARARRMLAAVLLACAVIAGICLADAESATLAAGRLLTPWSKQQWPRRNWLLFEDTPPRLARGEDFLVAVIDRNDRLPDRVTIYYWFDGDAREQIQAREMTFVDGRMVHRLSNITRSFRYRAEGGDDHSMAWIPLTVVEPPQVASLQVRLQPPAYTGWPSSTSDGRIQALEGTQVQLAGTLTKRVSAVYLRTDGKEVIADEPPRPIAAKISDDGTAFTLPQAAAAWRLKQSGQYWLELADRDGAHQDRKQRWDVRAVPDLPPTVSLEQPSSSTLATPNATVLVRALVKDDLAVHTVQLHYRLAGEDEETTVELHRGPDQVQPVADAEVAVLGPRGEGQTLVYAWDLSDIEGLKAGDSLEFEVIAGDYKPQLGRSAPRRLNLISEDELEDRIAQKQTYILNQLTETLRIQREARSQSTSLEIQLQEVRQFTKQDLDHLQSAELHQRQVGRLLSNQDNGVEAQITELLRDLDSNRVDRPEVTRQMSQVLDAVRQISRDQLPVVQRELIDALKGARSDLQRHQDAGQQPPFAVSDDVATALHRAGQQQDQVIADLEAMLGELSQWDSYRRFSRTVKQVLRDQEDVQKNTDQLRLETITQDTADLTQQKKADLKRLAQRQLELARRFDKVQSQMEQMRDELAERDPLASQTIADALDTARQLALSGQMRESGRNIEMNRVGQAAQQQQEVRDGLNELLDVLANRREHELGRMLRKLREASDELSQLRQRQKELRKKWQDAQQQRDDEARRRELQRLSKQQQDLAEQTQRLARRLQRLQADRASESLGNSAAQMSSASQSGSQGNDQNARQQAEQAERSLQQAEQQLAERIRQVEQDLFQEQLARLEQAVAGLMSRQQQLLETTVELEALRLQKGSFDRQQLVTVGELASQQHGLSAETGELADRLEQAEAFTLGLRDAIRAMARAATMLQRQLTGEPTQHAEQLALSRLALVHEALQPDQDPQANQDNPTGQAGENQAQPPTADAIQSLAQLKLVKLMQEEIKQRTAELDELRIRNGQWTEPQQRERTELSRRQGQLADILLNLIPVAEPNPQELPDGLPTDPDPRDGLDVELEKSLGDSLPSELKE